MDRSAPRQPAARVQLSLDPSDVEPRVEAAPPPARLCHRGWWNGFYPFIDYSTAGSIGGMIRATERNLSVVTDKMIIIPGHRPIGKETELAEYRDMLAAIRNNPGRTQATGEESLRNHRRETHRTVP